MTSSTPARSAGPPNASSDPPASATSSTWRSPAAASSTTTTTTPSTTKTCSPAATCSSPHSPPTKPTTAQVVVAYRQLQHVEPRFRVLKDFLHLRPVRHWTERRVRGHIAVCVYAAVIEALITAALAAADVRDPDLPDQHLSAARALRELARIRRVSLDAGDRHIDVITRRNPLQPASSPPSTSTPPTGTAPTSPDRTAQPPRCSGNTLQARPLPGATRTPRQIRVCGRRRRDPADERELLKDFKGIGDVGVDIFFRDVQTEWAQALPSADPARPAQP